nr:EOG090X02D0 [Eulimnadia texana]
MASKRVRSRKPAKEEICRFVMRQVPPSAAEEPLNLCTRDGSSTGSGSRSPEASSRSLEESSRSLEVEPTKIAKRRKKRSTIFVPPEKLSNEVSICKFKFVAGNQPRLQEKKVLSLDSGGNFRFFPEAAENSAAKPVPGLLPIKQALENNPEELPSGAEQSGSSLPGRKRQKTEKNFRDKGFLIQTQHVQATEGSVFCKFRQLKKFTRYLYRSWKDYLPEDRVLDT